MAFERQKILGNARLAVRESRTLEFKREFDISSPAMWCEVIKDVVAFANTDGGIILFGLENAGVSSGIDCTSLLALDLAELTNKIFKYTGYQCSEIDVLLVERDDGAKCPAFLITPTDVPIIFTKPGTYDAGDSKQKTAFSQGSLYFRHGAKSEPGNRDDLARWQDRMLAKQRRTLMQGMRKVVEAPADHIVAVVPSSAVSATGNPQISARFTDDPSAPAVREETILGQYPLSYDDLVKRLRGRYSDFKQNGRFHRVKRRLQKRPEYCRTRYLDPRIKKGGKDFFCEAIIGEFDQFYTRKPP